MANPIGLYLHIPFCRGKCPYCDFYSMRADAACMDTYTQALQKSLEQWAERIGRAADTLYLGGGTPSLLGGARIAALVQTARDCYGLRGAEITVECNPSDVDGHLFEALAGAGVSRISLGLQSAVDEERKALGRRAGVKEAAASIRLAGAAGIQNLSLDLMLGIPGQTAESLRRSIDFCTQAGVCHISAYLLKIEEGTPFAQRRASLVLPNEDTVCDLYEQACEELEAAGFQQYEISNFARPGFESRHNLKYWNLSEYMGLGAAAHSYIKNTRYSNLDNIIQYSHTMWSQDVASNIRIEGSEAFGADCVVESSVNTYMDNVSDYTFTALRTKQGVVFEDFRKRLKNEFWDIYALQRAEFEMFVQKGYAESDGRHIALTRKGIDISNRIMSLFV